MLVTPSLMHVKTRAGRSQQEDALALRADGAGSAVMPDGLAADQVLFLAGDPGDGCYRIEQGLLKVGIVGPSGAERILAILGPGAIVGELSTIDGLPRSASVTAVGVDMRTFPSTAGITARAPTETL